VVGALTGAGAGSLLAAVTGAGSAVCALVGVVPAPHTLPRFWLGAARIIQARAYISPARCV